MRQDLELCQDIILMRYFAFVHDEYKRDKKSLTPDREKFMLEMERLSGG